MVNFAGEDLSVLVIELGSNWIKAGYAGEEGPRLVLPGHIGSIEAYEAEAAQSSHKATAIKVSPSSYKSYFIGDMNVSHARPLMNIKPFLKDDTVQDSDDIIAILTYIFKDGLRVDASETPVLLGESIFMNKISREKIIDILFTKFNVPAVYVAKNHVLAAFSQGKGTCLVIDIGASNVAVTPIVDGYYLKNGAVKQSNAGNLLTAQCQALLEHELSLELRSHYEIASKEPVDAKASPKCVTRAFAKGVTESFKAFAKWRLVEDFKHCVCQVSETPYNAADLSLRPSRSFEFPDGYNQSFLAERYRIPEILFNPKEYIAPQAAEHLSSAQISNLLGLHELVQKSLGQVDIDLRASLCSNIVLFGASSLFHGLSERLSAELSALLPSHKFRIYASHSSSDRKFAPWIGGSILASLPSFQQLWMTRAEFDEHGASFIDKRCQL